ncbi:MerR HTH family regulatory protein [Bacillus sp. OV194]|nr:MerR HTH family regulatory protein [Bacillus sp. OV194]
MALKKNVDEVADFLGVKSSTIKKYYLLFEQQHNHRFERSKQGRVMFSLTDIELFYKVIQLKNEPGITVAKAVAIAFKEMKEGTPDPLQKVFEGIFQRIDDLDNLIKRQPRA